MSGKRVSEMTDAEVRAMAGSGPERRHPAEVTADRLLHAYERWSDRLTGAEGPAIGTVCRALTRIAQADQEAGQ